MLKEGQDALVSVLCSVFPRVIYSRDPCFFRLICTVSPDILGRHFWLTEQRVP